MRHPTRWPLLVILLCFTSGGREFVENGLSVDSSDATLLGGAQIGYPSLRTGQISQGMEEHNGNIYGSILPSTTTRAQSSGNIVIGYQVTNAEMTQGERDQIV